MGLKFTSNGNETCYVSGIGTCTDTDIKIPPVSPTGDRVTSIGNDAFAWCESLTSVVISDSVTSIGYNAFFSCTSLTSIKYRGTQKQWNTISKGDVWNGNTGSYTITYNYTGE